MWANSSSKTSSTQELTNSIAFNPIINVGDDNKNTSKADQRASQSATTQQKDEMTTTASVGVGVNGDGTGGAVESSKTGDNQPIAVKSVSDDFFSKDKTKLYLIAGGGVALLGATLYFFKGKKKKKR